MQENHNEIWKKMTTPIEVAIMRGEPFKTVKEKFNLCLKNNTCVRCPLSGTIHNMPYRRSISKGMARALKLLYRIQVQGINNGDAPNAISDFTKLRYWGLIKQDIDTGFWNITPQGIEFSQGTLKVAKNAIVVNNKFKEYIGDSVSINEILSK